MSNIYGDYWRNRKDQIDKDKEDALALLNSNKQNQIASNLGAYEQASLYYGNNAKRMAQMGLTGGGYGDYLKGNAYTDYLKGVHGINRAAMEQQQNIYGAYNDAKLAYDADFMKAKEGVYSNLFNMASSGAYNTFNQNQFNEQLGIYGNMLNETQKAGLQQIQAEQQNIYAQKKNIENFNIALNYANSGTYDAYTTDGQFNALKTQYGLNDDQINTIKRTISDKRFNKYLTNVASGFYDQIERSKVEEELKDSGLTKEQINNILGYYDTKKANASASVQTGGTGIQQPNAGGGNDDQNKDVPIGSPKYVPQDFFATAGSDQATAKAMLENYKKGDEYDQTTYEALETYYKENFREPANYESSALKALEAKRVKIAENPTFEEIDRLLYTVDSYQDLTAQEKADFKASVQAMRKELAQKTYDTTSQKIAEVELGKVNKSTAELRDIKNSLNSKNMAGLSASEKKSLTERVDRIIKNRVSKNITTTREAEQKTTKLYLDSLSKIQKLRYNQEKVNHLAAVPNIFKLNDSKTYSTAYAFNGKRFGSMSVALGQYVTITNNYGEKINVELKSMVTRGVEKDLNSGAMKIGEIKKHANGNYYIKYKSGKDSLMRLDNSTTEIARIDNILNKTN